MTTGQRTRLQVLVDDYRAAGFALPLITKAVRLLAAVISPPAIVAADLDGFLRGNGLPL